MKKHDLVHEFPAYREKILTLQKQSSRFKKLSDEYHETDRSIHQIEEGVTATTDEHLNELRLKRVHLKDSLYQLLA